MTDEEWRDIDEFEGQYQVSNLGRARSFARASYTEPKILKNIYDSDGYCLVNLCYKKRGIRNKLSRVHRLVAKAFIDNPNGFPEVNHKDEDKRNNCVDNLEWCATQYNLTYGNRLNCTYGSNNYHSKLTISQVREIRKVYKKGDLRFGQSDLGKKYGVTHGTIRHIVNCENWTHILPEWDEAFTDNEKEEQNANPLEKTDKP